MMVEKKQINFPRYEHYKDSGIEWIGEIPAHWDTLRGNYIFTVIDDRSERGEEDLLSVSEHTGVRYRSDMNVNMFMAESYAGYKICRPNDLVINSLWAWSRGLGVSSYHGIVSTAYSVYRPNLSKVNPSFLNYLLRIEQYISQYLIASKGIWISRLQLSDWRFLRIPILTPPLPEQTAIAQFLDHKTAQIDRAIAIKEAQIKLLNERKQIMIQEAVTKGLDPSVPMKDSGIEWIGEIPAHWDVKLLRHIGFTQNGVSEGAEYFGLGHPFVSYGDVYNDFQLPSSVKGLANSSELDRRLYSVQIGDVFFTRTSETIDEIGISSTCLQTIPNAVFSGFLIRFRPTKKELDEGFSSYYFSTTFVRNFFTSELNLVTRVSLSQGLLKKLPVLLPPKSEQKTIFNFLENQKEKINMAINVYESQIQTLKEYKTTLINEAVTGKIKVY